MRKSTKLHLQRARVKQSETKIALLEQYYSKPQVVLAFMGKATHNNGHSLLIPEDHSKMLSLEQARSNWSSIQ